MHVSLQDLIFKVLVINYMFKTEALDATVGLRES